MLRLLRRGLLLGGLIVPVLVSAMRSSEEDGPPAAPTNPWAWFCQGCPLRSCVYAFSCGTLCMPSEEKRRRLLAEEVAEDLADNRSQQRRPLSEDMRRPVLSSGDTVQGELGDRASTTLLPLLQTTVATWGTNTVVSWQNEETLRESTLRGDSTLGSSNTRNTSKRLSFPRINEEPED